MAITDYKRIEYIEGATNAYIDMGITGNRNYSYFAVCTLPTNIGSRVTLWGAEGSANKYTFGMIADGSAYRVRYATASPSVTPVVQSTVADPLKIEITMETSTSGGSIYIRDPATETTLATGSYSYGGTSANLNRNQYLLALNDSSGGTPKYPGINCRIYEFDVYNNITSSEGLIRQFVPIRNPNTGQVGMYDLVGDRAYWSGGSNFIAGPDVDAGCKIWIRSSGSWLSGTPYVRQSGSWTQGKPYIRQSGSWTQGS